MRHLSDRALTRLRAGPELPDLSGTRYRLLSPIARGGMGMVYAAEDEKLERRVALKVLEIPCAEGELASRLMREARVLARLEHPGIVPVHDVGTLADGRVFYTMKFVEGRRLDKYLERVESIPDKLRIFLRVCDPVAFAHSRGVLHRDIKPANIMVGLFGEVLVMDWGLAKIVAHASGDTVQDAEATVFESPKTISTHTDTRQVSEITGDGTVLGTPGYMSPEQARGEVESVDQRSDIFSLGALLRFMLNERNASGSPVRLDKSLEAIWEKASAEKPESRYASVQDLALDVSRYLDGLAVEAHRESFFEKAVRFYRRYRFFILLIAAYLLMRVMLLLILKR
jgi:eukaryotic-like serine/threonine-protein kinase